MLHQRSRSIFQFANLLFLCLICTPLAVAEDLRVAELSLAEPVPAGDALTPPGQNSAQEPQKRVLKPAENVDLSDVVVPAPAAPADLPAPDATSVSEHAGPATDALSPEPSESISTPVPAKPVTSPRDPAAAMPKPSSSAPTELPSSELPSELPSESPEVVAEEVSKEVSQESLVLFDTVVPAGTTTRLAWSPKVSFLGVSAPTPVLVVNGVKPGPTLCLTAAVHGDETNGIETVRRVLYSIDAKKLSGAIIGVPIVNLEGFRAGSRYLPDRRDLNRFFPGNSTGSAASRIAFSFFKEVISQCDMLIDLHTGSFGRTNLQQVRADLGAPGVKDLAEQMGRIVVVQSRGARGTLRRAAVEKGIPAVTLEAGAPNELDKVVVEESVKSVKNAMSGLGLLSSRKWLRRTDAPVYYKSSWVRASEGGFLISEAKLGASVQPGELLGVVTNPITNQRSEIRSPTVGRIIGMALNQVMQPGYAAYHLGIEPPVAASGSASLEQGIQIQNGIQDIEDDEGLGNDPELGR